MAQLVSRWKFADSAIRTNILLLEYVVDALTTRSTKCLLDLGQSVITFVQLGLAASNELVLQRAVAALCGIDLGHVVFGVQLGLAASNELVLQRAVGALCGIDLGHVDCLMLLKAEGCGRTDKKDCCQSVHFFFSLMCFIFVNSSLNLLAYISL